MRFRAVILMAALVGGACSDDAGSACVELREPADPQSFMHLIDPNGFEYSSHPPTSGPHLAVPAPSGVFDQPLIPALQVRVLESGGAVVQYDNVDAALREQIEGLASDVVVVAPGSALPAPVVVTAWTWKLTCSEAAAADLRAIQEFLDHRPADAPGVD